LEKSAVCCQTETLSGKHQIMAYRMSTFLPGSLSVLFLYAVVKQISWSEEGEEIQLAETPCWPPASPLL